MHTRRGRGVGVRVGHRRGSIFPLGELPPPSVRRKGGWIAKGESPPPPPPAQRKERARVNESGYMRKVKRAGRVCVHARAYERKRVFALRKGDGGWRQGGEKEAEGEREYRHGMGRKGRERERDSLGRSRYSALLQHPLPFSVAACALSLTRFL